MKVTADELMLWWTCDVTVKAMEAESIIKKSKEEIENLKAQRGNINLTQGELSNLDNKILELCEAVKKAETVLEISRIRLMDIESLTNFLDRYQHNNP